MIPPRPLLCGLLLACATLPGPASSQPLPAELPPGVTPDMVRQGDAIFHGKGMCTNCHGADARGLLGPDLTDDDWWHAKGSYLELVDRIRRGVPAEVSQAGIAMEPRGGSQISDEQVAAVAAYIWKLSHPEARDSLPAGVSPEMVREGDRVFHGPGRCHECHGEDARGRIGPDLTDHEWLHAKGGYLTIVQTILTGVPQGRSRTGVVMPPRGGAPLTDAEVHAVAAFVWALSRPGGR